MLSKSQQRLVIDLSKNLDIFSNYKHVSILTLKDVPVCFGFNDTRATHPIALRLGYRYASIHSEFNAICKFVCMKFHVKSHRLLEFKLPEYTLYNIRVDKNGNFRNAKPCVICQKLIKVMRIKRVYYTTPNGWQQISR